MGIIYAVIFIVVAGGCLWLLLTTTNYMIHVIEEIINQKFKKLEARLNNIDLHERRFIQERIGSLVGTVNELSRGFAEAQLNMPLVTFLTMLDLYTVWTKEYPMAILRGDSVLIQVGTKEYPLQDFLYKEFNRAMHQEVFEAEGIDFEGTRQEFIEHCLRILKDSEYELQ